MLDGEVILFWKKTSFWPALNSSRGFSQAFYREKLYTTVLGFKDLEDFMQNFWEKWACSKGMCTCIYAVPAIYNWRSLIDPDNLLVMVQTWQLGDVSKQEPYNGNFEAAMASIKAKVLVLPGKTDLYFPWVFAANDIKKNIGLIRNLNLYRPEDSEYEVQCMKPGIGKMDVFPSVWGRKYRIFRVELIYIVWYYIVELIALSHQIGPEPGTTRMIHSG